MPAERHELRMPDLEMGEIPVTASVWLVEQGAEVTLGDRLLEVVAGAATVDLPAPASGVLCELLVSEDDRLAAGQLLAVILGDEPDAE